MMASIFRINKRPKDDSSDDESNDDHKSSSPEDEKEITDTSLAAKLRNEPKVSSLKHVDEHINEFKKGVYKVTDGVFIAIGYALANSICVETSTGLVIIDVLEDVGAAREVCREFKRLTSNKPIKSVIFTHAHFDHIAGIKGFIENEPEEPIIYLHEDCHEHDMNDSVFRFGKGPRTMRQFGALLRNQVPFSKEKNWYKNAGIGPQINIVEEHNEHGDVIKEYEHSTANPETFKTFDEGHTFTQDGMEFEMVKAFGESDDQILIHVPSKSLLLPGDNIYRSFPNIYAIRGVEPRNAYAWYKSIEKMIDFVEKYKIQHLAPSHSRHIIGYNQIRDTLNVYRDGIAFVHDQTIRWLNQGYSQDEIIHQIQATKPKELFQNPYLLEFYGTIEWSVRAIYVKNMGWFSGKVDDLFPCSKAVRSKGTMQMMDYIHKTAQNGSNQCMEAKMVGFIESCYENSKNGQITGYLEGTTNDDCNRFLLEQTTQCIMALEKSAISKRVALMDRVRVVRWSVLRDMASYQTSAPARNYLLTYWLEEKYDIESIGVGNTMKDIAMKRPLSPLLHAIPFHVDPIKCQQNINGKITGIIDLYDVQQIYKISMKETGVIYMEKVDEYQESDKEIDWVLKSTEKIIKHLIYKGMEKAKNSLKRGHMIPRIRSGPSTLIAILLGMTTGMVTETKKSNDSSNNNQSNNLNDSKDSKNTNPLIKGQEKALEFFGCLDFTTISKLSIDPKRVNDDSDDQKTVVETNGDSGNGINLSGTWQLERNENLEEFLKSQGYGFAKRKISSIASITLKITHDGNALRVETITSFKSWALDMTIGGGNHETVDPVSGDKVQFTVDWKDDTERVLVFKIHNLNTKRIVTNKRSMPSHNEMVEKLSNDKGATMSRVFKRIQ